MWEIYTRAKGEVNYHATYFRSMLSEYGAVATARKLLSAPAVSDGFAALWERGRLDLTVEALVIQERFADLFSPAGRKLISEQRLDPPFHARVLSLLRLIDAYDFEIDAVTKRITAELKPHPGYQAIQTIPGVGPILAAIFVAEIGDITRFRRPDDLGKD